MSAALERAIAAVREPDAAAGADVQRRLDEKTKPRGSLGGLERLAVRIAGIQRTVDSRCSGTPVVVVCAADHGVAAEGVSAYPSSVTAQMVANYAAGGAAVSVLARRAGARLVVVDCGVAEPLPVPGRARPQARCRHGQHAARAGDAARACDRGARDGHRRSQASCSRGPGASHSARWGSATRPRPPRSAAPWRAPRRSRPAVAARVWTTKASRASATSSPARSRSTSRARTTPSACWRPWAGSSSECSPGSPWARPGAACPCSSTAIPPRPPCSLRQRWRRRCPHR